MAFQLYPTKFCSDALCRFLSTSHVRNKKEVYTGKQVEGVLVPSEREGKVVCLDGFGDPRDRDPISRLGLNIRHTDVRILSQFLRPDGTVLPRRISGISCRSQIHLELMIERARKAGLLPVQIKTNGSHVYERRGPHRFNVYYDSEMIGLPRASKKAVKYIPPE
uniref:30S ribosomal protein S18 n=1 Tax=Schistosoma haematobium TaxID=6185 RepID=A0A095AXT3_SCHHA